MRFLDADQNEGKSLEEIATQIVEGYLEAITLPAPALPLREGMLIKHVADGGKVRRVAWMQGDLVWLVTDTGGYGWLGTPSGETLKHCEEYRPKRRITIDGKGKMVEMSDEEIAEVWSNPDHSVGDQVSWRQRQYVYEIVATGPQCVLMRNVKTGQLSVDSNSNLKKYYKKEVKGAAEW